MPATKEEIDEYLRRCKAQRKAEANPCSTWQTGSHIDSLPREQNAPFPLHSAPLDLRKELG